MPRPEPPSDCANGSKRAPRIDDLDGRARASPRAPRRPVAGSAQTVISLGHELCAAHRSARPGRESGIGRISTYAQGADYHDVMKRRLKELGRWLVAAAPGRGTQGVRRYRAGDGEAAGRGGGTGLAGQAPIWSSRTHGGWLFLGAIYTTLELAPDAPVRSTCGSCDACQTACPTDAFPAPYRLDARRCISYLTIEHKGPIPQEFRAGIGNRIYGCDDCLAVCPWNKFAAGRPGEPGLPPAPS